MSTTRLTRAVFAFALLALIVPAAAVDSAASQPALDLSSPKSTLLAAYSALRAGDVASAGRCMVFADAAQAETFDITVTQLWALLSVMHAMEARFGAEARKLFSAASLEKTADQTVDEINRADITINGDTATVGDKKSSVDPSAETQVSGITLKKQNDQWRIVASTFPECSGEIPAGQLPMMRALKTAVASACQSTLARLARGDFKSADEAYAAYQAVLQQSARPTTAPQPPASK